MFKISSYFAYLEQTFLFFLHYYVHSVYFVFLLHIRDNEFAHPQSSVAENHRSFIEARTL